VSAKFPGAGDLTHTRRRRRRGHQADRPRPAGTV